MFSIKERRNKSIRFRLMLDIGIILIFGCIFNYVLVRFIYQEILLSQVNEKKQIVAHAAIQQAQLINQNAHGLLSNIIQIFDIDDTSSDITEKLKHVEVFTSRFKDVVIVDLDGKGIGISRKKYDLSDSDIIQKALKGEQISFEVLEHNNELYIAFGQVITNNVENKKGILLGIQNIDMFFHQITNVSGGEICFVGNAVGDGFMVSGNKGTIDDITVLSDDIGIQNLFETSIMDGENYAIKANDNKYYYEINYGKILGTDWMLGIISYNNEIGTILTDFRSAMFVGTVVSIAIGLVLIYFITSSIVQRITNISKYIEENIENEFKEPIPKELLANEDEIGKLARGMKQLEEVVREMLCSVKDSVDYLNDKVNFMNYQRVQEESRD